MTDWGKQRHTASRHGDPTRCDQYASAERRIEMESGEYCVCMDSEIGSFLTARRARIAPEDRGLISGARRRVPGLRREEVALLAGVSVDYYVRLEQGRADAPSESILRAIATVLGLDAVAYEHLVRLARPQREQAVPPQQRVRPELKALLDTMHRVPAFVAGRWQEILYANALGEALLPAHYPGPTRNAARHVFLSADAIEYYVDWDTVAADTVATLRHESGRYPGDLVLAGLVGELSVASPAFANLWAHHDVQLVPTGIIRIHHPRVGRLNLNYEFLRPGDEAELIVTYVAGDRGSADGLTLLETLAGPTADKESGSADEQQSLKQDEQDR
jgi:transcriptional regulator with XRE-family HTH domain